MKSRGDVRVVDGSEGDIESSLSLGCYRALCLVEEVLVIGVDGDEVLGRGLGRVFPPFGWILFASRRLWAPLAW